MEYEVQRINTNTKVDTYGYAQQLTAKSLFLKKKAYTIFRKE